MGERAAAYAARLLGAGGNESRKETDMDWTYLQLSALWFFEFAVWGAWMPVLAARLLGPLKFSGKQTGWVYATLPLSSMVSPLIFGYLADTWINVEWLLACCHVVGAVLLYAAARQTQFKGMFLTMLGYTFFYAATLALVNAMVFRNVAGAEAPKVFIWAPIGWAAIGWFLTGLRQARGGEAGGADALNLAAVLSLILAVVCLFQPATPPASKIADGKAAGQQAADGKPSDAGAEKAAAKADGAAEPSGDKAENTAATGAGADRPAAAQPAEAAKKPATGAANEGSPLLLALGMLGQPYYLLFILVSLCAAGTMQFYFLGSAPFMQAMGIDGKNVSATMAIAQAVQAVATWFILGVLWSQAGPKWTLAIGAACWAALYVIYVAGKPRGLIVAGQGLHGLAYVFFINGGWMFADLVAPEAIKASAQSVLILATNGIGLFLGTQLAGWTMDRYGRDGQFQWPRIWMVPLAITAAAAVLLAVAFYPVIPPKP